ncbi:Transposon Tf2-9 polyprotein [Thelohanellus kitauei]|uniref:RNA-directed DNA polymerase n=1 Tax=Thelohanellus kitauei TaxID=669202 RepID=A0A0C2NF36_THEKT|nr:Transposon Tf2-9 polyprotein [Thelohanellus kitauei]
MEEANTNNKPFTFEQFEETKDEWNFYLERFELAASINGMALEGDQANANLKKHLLNSLGARHYRFVRESIPGKTPNDLTYKDVVDTMSKKYGKHRNVVYERFKFTHIYRRADQSMKDFESTLREGAVYCDFGSTLELRIRDQFIMGVNEKSIQQDLLKLFSSNDSKADDVIRHAEVAFNSMKDAEKMYTKTKDQNDTSYQNEVFLVSSKNERQKTMITLDSEKECLRCGRLKHKYQGDCPAKDKECLACGGHGHFARACLKSGKATLKKKSKINAFSDSNNPNSFSKYSESFKHPNKINHIKPHSNDFVADVNINGRKITMSMDTGAQVSCIGEETWKQIGCPELAQTSNLKAYTFQTIETLGSTKVNVEFGGKSHYLDVIVTKINDIPIFGRNWMCIFDITLSLPRVNTLNADSDILKEYIDVFTPNTRGIKNHVATIILKNDAKPVVHKPRPIPFTLKPLVENELTRLVEEGVLERVDPTTEEIPWACPIVCVKKHDGGIRICGDFRGTINQYIDPPPFPLPSIDEILNTIRGGNRFTVLDLKDAYLQLAVDEKSKKLLVINTPCGFFHYKRLPFGVSSSPAIFQATMAKILSGIPNVAFYLDDIIVTGRDDKLHEDNLREVLNRLRQCNVTSRKDKCQFFMEEVEYLGHRISKNGIRPLTDKIDSLKQLPPPSNKTELKSFLGAISFYSRYIPRLHELCRPLYDLTLKNANWIWNESHGRVYEDIKSRLSSNCLLVHFDESRDIHIYTDASNKGVGAVLMQPGADNRDYPVVCASRTLNSSERNYSVTEKEALSIIFAIKKFNQYLYGRSFKIFSDHKPLERLLSHRNGLSTAASGRIARWWHLISCYDYSIHYKKAEENKFADTLSRLPIEESTENDLDDLATLINLVTQSFNLIKKMLRIATTNDALLGKVIKYLNMGWPDRKEIDKSLHPYYDKRFNISYDDGILVWNDRIIIPPALRQELNDYLHTGHPGIEAMKALARETIWWPRMGEDIELHVKSCESCQRNGPNIAETPITPSFLPYKPWDRLHLDFAESPDRDMWLLICDAFTKWVEVFPMGKATSTNVIIRLEECLSRFGIPRVVVTDNGPQFTSHEFTCFCKDQGIKHVLTTPYHSRSNGMAERSIRSIKEKYSKITGADKGKRLYTALF